MFELSEWGITYIGDCVNVVDKILKIQPVFPPFMCPKVIDKRSTLMGIDLLSEIKHSTIYIIKHFPLVLSSFILNFLKQHQIFSKVAVFDEITNNFGQLWFNPVFAEVMFFNFSFQYRTFLPSRTFISGCNLEKMCVLWFNILPGYGLTRKVLSGNHSYVLGKLTKNANQFSETKRYFSSASNVINFIAYLKLVN